MRAISCTGNPELATVHVAELDDGCRIEFCESVQPPRPIGEKWVNVISTMAGCPVGCKMCDAGGSFVRPLTAEEMLAQVEHLAGYKFPDGVKTGMWKLQLARMGEPTMNREVLRFLDCLGGHAPTWMVISLSTVAPSTCAPFVQELRRIKDRHFPGRFQLQFSIHTTDDAARRRLIPVKSLILPEMAALGRQFRSVGDRKVTLNFIVMKSVEIDPERIARVFDPDNFLIKLTPLNPTYRAMYHGLLPGFEAEKPDQASELIAEFEARGFEVILSVGELEENHIGSNCGQYINTNIKI